MLGNSDTVTGGEDGDGPTTDWLRAPLNLDADASVVKSARDYGYCQECIDRASDAAGGIAVWEDSIGFVYSRSFDTKEKFDAALSECEDADQDSQEEDANETA